MIHFSLPVNRSFWVSFHIGSFSANELLLWLSAVAEAEELELSGQFQVHAALERALFVFNSDGKNWIWFKDRNYFSHQLKYKSDNIKDFLHIHLVIKAHGWSLIASRHHADLFNIMI